MPAPKVSLSMKNNGVLANKKRIESALLFHLVMELDYFLQKQIKEEFRVFGARLFFSLTIKKPLISSLNFRHKKTLIKSVDSLLLDFSGCGSQNL